MSFRFASALLFALLLSGFTWADRPADIDNAARAFRVRVYRTFRNNRAEYDRRMEQGKEVLSAWSGGGTPAEEQDVLKWFLAATEASTDGATSELPTLAVMDTLNSRRLAYNSKKKKKKADANAARKARLAKKNQGSFPRPVQQAATQPTPAKKGLGGLMGQLVNQGMSLMGGGSSAAPTNAGPVNSPLANSASSHTQGMSEMPDETMIALNRDGLDADSSKYDEQVNSINEVIVGQNLTVEEVRSKLQSEWNFDPASAEELIANLESLAANELELGKEVSMIPPSYHSKIDAIVSVNDLLGQVNDRLIALKEGREAFADAGFGLDDAQSLFDRLEKIRDDLSF
jgi:hypothetical protein